MLGKLLVRVGCHVDIFLLFFSRERLLYNFDPICGVRSCRGYLSFRLHDLAAWRFALE